MLQFLHSRHVLREWPVDPGFPELDNRDAANPGKGERVATWRATLPESAVLGNVFTHVQVVDGAGHLLVAEECSTPVHKEAGKQLLVYVNEHIR